MMAKRGDKTAMLTVRLSENRKQALDEAATTGPYRISATSIVERGIDLAIAELNAMRNAAEAH
ncbi:hypothetical protein [Aurantimonas coralicida]|uniref:hypothetical protein n=1 Tax=Aurantimonas coralicida TaxID=182270 RepID=UPI001E343743|nr:hypothetical protein [Aurantimonas coralicida]MCD1645301.1 hypothetical protein [Aurantimonas coralicida]